MLKKFAYAIAAGVIALSSPAKAEKAPRTSVSIGGSYAREITSDSAYYAQLDRIRETLNMYKPLTPSGASLDIRVGAFLGNGYSLECEVAGLYRPGSTGGRVEFINEALLSYIWHKEWRGEIWINVLREFYPFNDNSSVYFGAGFGMLVEATKFSFGYNGAVFPEVHENYDYTAIGVVPGAKIFAGSSIQIYKGLFLNLRPGLKFSSMMMDVKEDVKENGEDSGILPEKMRKSHFELDLNVAAEWRF